MLADGSLFEGELLGAEPAGGVASGEVVFNTVLSGYQEVITDPSYAGQIISFTATHIGNYGVNVTDFEARRPFCRGVVVREMARRHSNHRAEGDLDAMLGAYGIPGIGGIDTRRLTRLVRSTGAIPGAFGAGDEASLLAAARAEPGTDGIDLVAQVTTPHSYTVTSTAGTASPLRIVAYDFGIKRTILHRLAQIGTVHVVPASTPADEVLGYEPDGVFLSNGPGDPAMVPDSVAAIRELIGEVPIFGICLGHQLLGRALGAGTVKLPFGHHGGNHPVKNLMRDSVEITSQNHNFAVDPDTLPAGVEMTHVNLNDGVCEGLRVVGEQVCSVQHHPEAGPGPHDSTYLFDDFATTLQRRRTSTGRTAVSVVSGVQPGPDGTTPGTPGMPEAERGVG